MYDIIALQLDGSPEPRLRAFRPPDPVPSSTRPLPDTRQPLVVDRRRVCATEVI